jgi:hypothetical protein
VLLDFLFDFPSARESLWENYVVAFAEFDVSFRLVEDGFALGFGIGVNVIFVLYPAW